MLSTVEKLLFLKGIDLFQKLSNEDLVQIAQIAEEVHFEREEPLIVEGDMGDALFITVAGHVRISKEGKQLNELGDGEVLGEMGILDSAPRSASVTAIDDVTALKLERDAFHELMSERQEIAQGIIHVLLHRLRALSQIKADEIQKAKGTQPSQPPSAPGDVAEGKAEEASGEADAQATKTEAPTAEDNGVEVAEVAEAIEAAGVATETAVELAVDAATPTYDEAEQADVASSETSGPASGAASSEASDTHDVTDANDGTTDTTDGAAMTPKDIATSRDADDAANDQPEGRERSKPKSPKEHDGEE